MPLFFGGQGVNPDLQGYTTNVITLEAGQCYELPNNWFEVRTGKYTTLQEFDPIIQAYRSPGAGGTGGSLERIKGDGNNYRLANQTGCAIGALVTTAGSGYTSAPTVTATSGGSLWRAIVGGAVNTSVTVTNGGSGYTYAPLVLFAVPAAGGVQATGYCTLSAGAVSTVTITDQGAGYGAAPIIQFQNDPREGVNGIASGSGASAIATLTGSGTITAIICIDHGNPTAANTVPSLTIAGGGGSSGAATAIMCWSMTAYTVSATTAGTGYVTPTIVSAYGGFPATAASYTNPTVQSALLKGRTAFIAAAVSGTALTATGQTVFDGGIYAGTPTVFTYGGFPQGSGAAAAVLSATLGGQTDTSIVLTT